MKLFVVSMEDLEQVVRKVLVDGEVKSKWVEKSGKIGGIYDGDKVRDVVYLDLVGFDEDVKGDWEITVSLGDVMSGVFRCVRSVLGDFMVER